MNTILFFVSATRHSCRKRLNGAFRFFKGTNYRLQVVERRYEEIPIKSILDFWQPVGCIAECGSGAKELKQKAFGKIPVVYIDLDPLSSRSVTYLVRSDSSLVGELAARELMQLGLENFCFVGFSKRFFWQVDREKAFSEAIRMNGKSYWAFHDRSAGNQMKRTTELRRWLSEIPKPCAIFTAMDLVSEEVIDICGGLRLSVPGDVMVLGVDNDEEICENAKPTLSSIGQDFERAGYLAAELLAMRLKNPRLGRQERIFGISGVVHRQSTSVYYRRDTRVMKALEFIRQHACEGLNVPEVVSMMGCSRRLAELRYREITGRTIKETIDATRLERVQAYLREGMESISRISAMCGFGDVSSLRKSFRKATGLSMREWKKRH